MVHRSKKLIKTDSDRKVPMIGYATIVFSYEHNGEYSFPLTVKFNKTKTQNLLRMEFCLIQTSENHFNLPGIELRQTPKIFCYGSPQRNKSFLTFSEF